MSDIRVRFAPSPTGRMHVGNFRSALYNFFFARKHGGVFYIRIEDTDRARMVEGGVESILRTLSAMGLSYEEGPFLASDGTLEERGQHGPYVQSRRLDIYKQHLELLIEAGAVYPCFCSAERLDEEAAHLPTGYDRHCRTLDPDEAARRRTSEPYVIRFKMPAEGETEFHDLIRGPVTFRNVLLDDYVLLKSDGYPTYHLANVIDDHLMKTSHVIRGEEWLPSTPKHVLLYRAFGWEPPRFAHLPLLLNPDRSKLSKRQGDAAVEDYLEKGYLPEALLNFTALLGWNPSDEKEVYALQELVDAFELEKVNSAGAVFNHEKLDWLNGKYLRALPLAELARKAGPFLERAGIVKLENDSAIVAATGERLSMDELGNALSLERERVRTLGELPEAVAFLFGEAPEYPPERLIWKDMSPAEVAVRVVGLLECVGGIDETEFDRKNLEDRLKAFIAERGWGTGDTLWPLRVALSGREKSPGPFEIMEILGKMKTIRRLETARDRLR